MKKFKILTSAMDKKLYYIKIDISPHDTDIVRITSLMYYYKIDVPTILMKIKENNGIYMGKKGNAIYFKKEKYAQSFIDNVLVPCEIAFNINN